WTSTGTTIGTGSTTGIVTGLLPGTATVTYTLPTTCLITRSVTVNPLPTAITGADGVCLGLTIAVTDTTSGGTWSSSDLSVAAISGTGIITGIFPGPSTITYMLTSGCLTTKTVTVNRLPSAVSGNMTICVAQTTALTDSISGGTW